MHRFYCPHADFSSKVVRISDPHEIHHIKDVLRLKPSAEMCVFNNENEEARVVITEIREGEIMVRVEGVRQSALTGNVKIVLACAVPKKAKFEFIIEKCTELGVDAIIPLKTKRAEVVFSKEKILAKQMRFEKVAVNAAKQCGRNNIPHIAAMTPVAEVFQGLDPDGLAIIPSLNGNNPHIRDVISQNTKPSSVTIFIGPEGDFTPDEVALAVGAGCRPVSLGGTVLKVDTAAIAAVALARFLFLD